MGAHYRQWLEEAQEPSRQSSPTAVASNPIWFKQEITIKTVAVGLKKKQGSKKGAKSESYMPIKQDAMYNNYT